MNMKDEAGLGLAILSVQQALILAYEHNYPLKPDRGDQSTLSHPSPHASTR